MKRFIKKVTSVLLVLIMAIGFVPIGDLLPGWASFDGLSTSAGAIDGQPLTKEEINQTVATGIANIKASVDSNFNGHYGYNGSFLMPIDPPIEGSIPISNREELEAIASKLSANYHLVADIDLGGDEWVPIGTSGAPFTGIFDGQGHVIKDLTIIGGTYLNNGLFGFYYGELIKNVGLVGTHIDVSSSGAVGGIVGSANVYGISSVTISGCYNTGDVSSSFSSSFSSSSVGGIVGYAYSPTSVTISGCYNTGDVSSSGIVGGIVGYAAATSATINKCYNTGDLSSSGTVGGIVGVSSSIINGCYNTGNITSSFSSSGVGGIVGYATALETINECYNNGDVYSYSSSNVGGIAGVAYSDTIGSMSDCYNTGDVYSYSGDVGGIAGSCASFDAILTISDCYNSGCVSSYSGDVGGVVESASNVTIRECYNSGDISSSSTVGTVGGIVGVSSFVTIGECYNTGDISSSGIVVGGIVGVSHYSNTTISDCYNTGDISSSGTVGGIVGSASDAIISECFNSGDVSFYSASCAGGIVGSAQGATVSECFNSGDVYSYSDTTNSSSYVGGIIGYVYVFITISRCYNTGNVDVYVGDVGGVIGHGDFYDTAAAISECYNMGGISSSYSGDVGGIAGFVSSYYSYSTVTISGCYNTGDISSSSSYTYSIDVGGIVGSASSYYSSSLTINGCYNIGNVLGSGIVGSASGSIINNCYNTGNATGSGIAGSISESTTISGCHNEGSVSGSGIVGSASDSTISDCYNTGNVSSSGADWVYSGGIVGSASDSTISDCYNTGNVSSSATYSGYAGGIVGYAPYDSIVTVSNCDNKGSVSSSGSSSTYTGGIVGYISGSSQDVAYIDGCENTGVLTASTTGNIVGYFSGTIIGSNYGDDYIEDGTLKIKSVTSPSKARLSHTSQIGGIDGTLTAAVPYATTSPLLINITPSVEGATWKLYSGTNKIGLISNNSLTLNVGENTAYIVLSASGMADVSYKVVITRAAYVDPAAISQKIITFNAGLADVGNQSVNLDIRWGWNLFKDSAVTYNNDIAIAGLALSGATENGTGNVSSMLTTLGFSNINMSRHTYEGDYAVYTFAKQTIVLDGMSYNLIAVVARGTTSLGDFIYDAHPAGFNAFANEIYAKLKTYLGYFDIDIGDSNNKFFIAGHSLGGAAANILGLKIGSDSPSRNNFVYTFACPLTTPNAGNISNIHNIVNDEDIVPHLSTALFSSRFGKTYPFNRNDLSAMKSTFATLTNGKNIDRMIADSALSLLPGVKLAIAKFLTGHDTTTYMAYLLAGGGTYTYTNIYRQKVVYVRCPVDVAVYNEEGILVGSVVNNVVDLDIASDVFIVVDGDEKCIYMPFDGEYTYSLLGTADGIMNFSIEEREPDTGVVSLEKSYNNVALTAGKQMSSVVGGAIDTPDVQLYVVDTTGEVTATIAENGTETPIGDTNTQPVPLQSISLNKTSTSLTKGKTETLTVKFNPVNTTDSKTASWSTSNSAVATVADGVVTAVNAGTTTITATVGSKTATCNVTVTESTGNQSNTGDSDSVLSVPQIPVYGGGGTTATGKDPVKNADGTTTYPGGGTFKFDNGTTVEVSDGAVVDADGTVTIPVNGSATVITPGGVKVETGGGVTITADGKITVPKYSHATVTYADGTTAYVPGGYIIEILDFDAPLSDGLNIFWNNPFTDISEFNWFYDAVEFAYTHDLFAGTSATTFSPKTTMSRAMVAMVLYKLAGSPSANANGVPFADVSDGKYNADAVTWAVENGLMSDIGENRFDPDAPMTRQDLTVILYKFAVLTGKSPQGNWAIRLDYVDFDKVADYATEALMWATLKGIVGGKPGKVFDPNGVASRAEVAAILRGFIEAAE